ncbi:unnamed protein product [Pylaiella littoralis]
MDVSSATPVRPKTPGTPVVPGPEEAATTPLSVGANAAAAAAAAAAGAVGGGAQTPAVEAVVFRTPRRKSTDEENIHHHRRCSSSTSKSSCSPRKAASGGKMSVAGDGIDSSGGPPRTPAAYKGGSCAICLSPLRKSSSPGFQKGEQVYTVQLCRHNFHRTCLVENRRAGNVGCPYCRGPLARGLTPETSSEEREARAVAERQQDQREAIRNAAGRARMALARSLRLRQEAAVREAASARSAAPQEEAALQTSLISSNSRSLSRLS